MNRRTRSSFNGQLALLGLFIPLLIASCASLPRPHSADSSLLVMVSPDSSSSSIISDKAVLEGPVRVSIDLKRQRVGMVSVVPGTYRVVSRTLKFRGGRTRSFDSFPAARVQIPAGTIVLPVWSFPSIDPESAKSTTVETSPADRRVAANTLRDYVRIAEWAGRRVAGFSPYSPFSDFATTQYTVTISSNPAGAQLSIDGQDWGKTPLPVKLPPGKHFVSLTLAGYERHTAFIDVGAAGTEHFDLIPASQSTALSATAKPTVMIEPFSNLSSSSFDNLSGVLTSSLRVALGKAGVKILEDKGQTAGGSSGPDFAAAEKSGAQAFIAGDYAATSDSILIHAALYDTRTHLVKASVLFNGAAGVDLFDSIDRMSAQLGSSVEKALPKVGQAVVQERVITPEAVTFNSRLHEQDVVRKRNEKPYSVSAGLSLAGMMDEVADPANAANQRSRMSGGPALGIYAGADLPLAGPATVRLATMPMIFQDANSKTKVELPLYFGVRYNFYGFMSDVYMGLQGAVHYAPSSAVDFSGYGGSGIIDVGPFWLAGLNFETGVKIYTYQRSSTLPSFLGFGLTLGLFGYRFDLNLTNPVFYPMEIGLRVYWGTRL